MIKGMRLLPALALCAGLILPACTSTPRPVPPAFFPPLPPDTANVQRLIREQEHRLQTCAAERVCPRAHYLRGLAALYEDRAVARTHFQAVLAAEPDGPYAFSSRTWLLLLNDGRLESARETRLVRAMERVVRQVLDDEATARALREAKPSAAALKEAQGVQELKRQLKEREREIDVLTEQIDALKRVDQEVRDQVKPSRPAK